MWYGNALIFTPEGYRRGSFEVRDGRFGAIRGETRDGEDTVDLGGARVIPGLVDIHVHGNSGADFSDGDAAGLRKMAAFLAVHGVTAFTPTSMTLPYDRLARAFGTAQALRAEQPPHCARVMGVHMEGPFFAESKKGAQNGAYLRKPDAEAFEALQRGCGNLIRLVDVAPELEGAEDFIRQAKESSTVSVAHTDARYAEACAAFDTGASHITHLFNAMPPLHHRNPGVIGAGSEREGVVAELICDGYHVHPSAVRMAFRLFPERICLISDALRCCGMPEGEYELGGQPVFLKDHVARLADGTIAGSVATVADCLRNAVAFGIPEEEAIRAATVRPAKEIGAEAEIGSVAPGLLADFIVCGEDLRPAAVYIGGVRVHGT